MTTIPGTLSQADRSFTVCVFGVDGGDLVYEYHNFGSEHIARFHAGMLVERMHMSQNGVRSVSIKRPDGSWETIGSYYDIGIAYSDE